MIHMGIQKEKQKEIKENFNKLLVLVFPLTENIVLKALDMEEMQAIRK